MPLNLLMDSKKGYSIRIPFLVIGISSRMQWKGSLQDVFNQLMLECESGSECLKRVLIHAKRQWVAPHIMRAYFNAVVLIRLPYAQVQQTVA